MSLNFKVTQCLEWCTRPSFRVPPQDSPVFLLHGNEWFLRFIHWEDRSGSMYCGIYLLLKHQHADLKPTRVKFEVGFKNEKSLSLGKGEFNVVSNSYKVWYKSLDECMQKKPYSSYMKDSIIKFVFNFNDVVEPPLKSNMDISHKAMQTPSYMDTNLLLEGVSKDLSTLFDEGPSHDVEFVCEDQVIKAHKNIICCRSDVFSSMFLSDMEEGKTGQVTITDIDSSILHHFLRYLHTGVLPELTVDTALQFYEAADKYAVHVLKKLCSSFLAENLSHENVSEILILSDRHNDPDLKKDAMEYMMKEKTPRRIGEKWTDFCRQNQTLANEVLNFLYLSC